MGYMTPKTDWIVGDGFGFSDANRIEGNILYLREEDKTINGTNTFKGKTTIDINGEGLFLGTGLLTTVYQTFRASSNGMQIGFSGEDFYGQTGFGLIKTGTSKGFGISAGNSADFGDVAESDIDYRVTSDGRHIFGRNSTTTTATIAEFSSSAASIFGDQDKAITLGRMKVGGIFDNEAVLSHIDHFNIDDAAIRQNSNGTTIASFTTGQSFLVRENGVTIANFNGSAVTINKPLTVNGSALFTGDISPARTYGEYNTESSIFSSLSPWLDSAGGFDSFTGTIKAGGAIKGFVLGLYRSSATTIQVSYKNVATSTLGYYNIDSGSSNYLYLAIKSLNILSAT